MPWRISEDIQIWRLVLSLYLSQGFSQVFINCLLQMFSGFMLEAQMGSLRMALFWFTGGILANLFGATTTDYYATGAEPAVFCMLMGLVAMYVYYWDRMGDDFCRKFCGLIMMILILVIAIFILTAFAEGVSTYSKVARIEYPDGTGFLGGALFGMPLAWAFLRPTQGSLGKASRRELGLFIGGLVWAVVLATIIIVAFITGEYKEYWSYTNL